MLTKIASLPPPIIHVIQAKGTEQPFTGEYDNFGDVGTYLCRCCGHALFRSNTKFHSGCGWPSFDDNIPGAILREPDADGRRVEILCAACRAHLGHVFEGEGFTIQNIRHCVNSLSLDFVANTEVIETQEIILAAGCFWGVEYYLKRLPGVLKTEVGYTGGTRSYPTYEQVCSQATGHYEAIRVIYDPKKLTDIDLIKYFFEIHDFTQTNGQGPDIGPQYLSAIFYYDDEQKEIAKRVMDRLTDMGYVVATKLLPVSVFWQAEAYHLDYYAKTGKHPYCHQFKKIFSEDE